MATSDIDSLLKETDQFLAQHNLTQAAPSTPLPIPVSSDDDNDDDELGGEQVDRLLRDTDSLLRDIVRESSPLPPPSPPPMHRDSDSSSEQAMKSTRLSFDESDSDVNAFDNEDASRPTILRTSPVRHDHHDQLPDFELSRLNRMLTQCGFSCLDNHEPTRADLSRSLISVLTQYEVKGELIQSLLDQENRVKSSSESLSDSLESDNKSLSAKLQEAQRTIDNLRAASISTPGNLPSSDSNELVRLRSKHRSLKSKVEQLENESRKREAIIEEMRETIASYNAKETLRRQRDLDLFRKMFDRGPRPSSSKDTRTLELISAFESQRARMQEEIDTLSRRLVRLAEEDARHDRNLRKADADELHKTVEQLREENAKIKEELSHRPSQRQHLDLQCELKTTRAQLVEARSVADVRARMSTRELIDRDRDVHRLGLTKIENLPQPICVEILQDVCRALQIDDAALIVAAVKKICVAVARIPLLQNIVRDVVDLAGVEVGDSLLSVSKRIIPVITSWKADMKTLAQLEAFQRDLWHRLRARSATARHGATEPMRTIGQNSAMLAAIDELIRTEAFLLDSKQAYDNLDLHLNARPEILCNKIVQHFMQLFKVESIEGLLPAMSRISVDLESAHNFLNALRSTLGLDSNASVSAVMGQVQRLAGIGLGDVRSEEPDLITVLIQLRKLLKVDKNAGLAIACRT